MGALVTEPHLKCDAIWVLGGDWRSSILDPTRVRGVEEIL
jgi:hypothetical protein